MGDSFGDNPWGNHEQVFGESNCVFSVRDAQEVWVCRCSTTTTT